MYISLSQRSKWKLSLRTQSGKGRCFSYIKALERHQESLSSNSLSPNSLSPNSLSTSNDLSSSTNSDLSYISSSRPHFIQNSLIGTEVQYDTAIILQGLGLTAKALSDQSAEQNAQLISLLLKSQQEITVLRDDLIESQKRQADLLLQVQNLTLQIAKATSDRDLSDKAKEALREKKRTRKRKPLKDPFERSDLINVLKLIKGKYKETILSSRYSVCVTLLYLFGVRVNELRQIKIGHLHQYMEGKPLSLQIGKTKIRSKVSFPSAKGTREFLNQLCSSDLEFLLTTQPHESLLVPVSREHLTRELNAIIRNYGITVHKTLLSHSCRVSFITRVCKNSGIEAARAMVGHAHISTTQVYNRNYLSSRAQQRIFNDSLKESEGPFDSSELENLLDQEDLT